MAKGIPNIFHPGSGEVNNPSWSKGSRSLAEKAHCFNWSKMFYQLRGMLCIETLIWEFQFKCMHAIGRQTMLLTQRHKQGINIHSDKVSKISGKNPPLLEAVSSTLLPIKDLTNNGFFL